MHARFRSIDLSNADDVDALFDVRTGIDALAARPRLHPSALVGFSILSEVDCAERSKFTRVVLASADQTPTRDPTPPVNSSSDDSADSSPISRVVAAVRRTCAKDARPSNDDDDGDAGADDATTDDDSGADDDRVVVDEKLTGSASRAVATMLGNALGDALGAPFEFSSVRYDVNELGVEGFKATHLWTGWSYNRFDLQPGQWTDDASMALCLADSLLVNANFKPRDLRLRFALWWNTGYNNAFGNDENRRRGRTSVGLGGNIGASLSEFMDNRTKFTRAGNLRTSGNGSLMRNGAVPVTFSGRRGEAQSNTDADADADAGAGADADADADADVDVDVASSSSAGSRVDSRLSTCLRRGMRIAYRQSKTTHQGDEAAECCRLLTYICIRAIRTGDGKRVLASLPGDFETDCYSVACMARSQAEKAHKSNAELNLADRDWRWRADTYRYCSSRARKMPGYIGSYAMDGLAMALHCVWTTDSFTSAVLKCINMRGDADTTGAITGQLAGALYGIEAIPADWIRQLNKWDNGDIAYKAIKLFRNETVGATNEANEA